MTNGSSEPPASSRPAASDLETEQADFLARVAHGLRTPLSPMVGALQMLEAEALNERARRCVSVLSRNLGQLTRLIDDLADMVRLQRGALRLELADLEAGELVARVVAAQEPVAVRRGVILRHEGGAGVVLRADAGRLTQALGHLVANAIRFSSEGGTVELRAEASGDRLRLLVTDHGCGIEPTRLRGLLEPGVAWHRESAPSGVGLGLPLAQGIVTAHGGTLTLESAGPGQGTRVIVALPAAGALPRRFLPRHHPGPLRLLLVEDHDDLLALTRMQLERHGYEVVTARSVAEAQARGAETAFDVLVTDIGLPDDSGLVILPELSRRAPVLGIAISGFGREADVTRSRAAGFVEHLTKPLDVQKLHELIARHLG